MTLGSLRRKDLSNQRFGKLVAIEVDSSFKLPIRWTCKCDCGKIKPIRAWLLTNGGSKSCGCGRLAPPPQITTHAMSNTRTYRIWQGILQRCYNKKAKVYKLYGAIGITTEPRWRDSFENFLSDMGESPEKHSIDRINGNLGYSKENCRWATQVTQTRNTKAPNTNTSGHKGISYRKDRKKWEVYIFFDGKRIRLGYFISLESAIEARKEAELKYWGEYYSGNYGTSENPVHL